MNLKLGIVFERKPDMNKLEEIVEDTLYPYLSTTPKKQVALKNCTKNDMKEKYKQYKEDYYHGVSFKKRKEDMISKGIDTLEGFCKNIYGIICFNENGDGVVGFNDKAIIDEYEIEGIDRVKDIDCEYLTMYLNALIDKDLKLHKRELQVYKRTPSVVITPVVESLKKTDYIVFVKYTF